ncbi:MAG: hypothetical protein V4459_00735 [Pseudomonadota bacterium]
MFMRLGIRFAVLGTVLVGVTVWHCTDRALNYAEVQGRVDSVSATCYIKGARGTLAYIDDCDQIAGLVAEGKVEASDVSRTTRVTVRYTSPADGQVHSGTFKTTSKTPDPTMVGGGVVSIYASKTDPQKIERQ